MVANGVPHNAVHRLPQGVLYCLYIIWFHTTCRNVIINAHKKSIAFTALIFRKLMNGQ
jgi:hypothetical protein